MFAFFVARLSRLRYSIENRVVQAIKEVLYLKGTTLRKFLYDMKETLRESALTYATVAKCHAEFKREKLMRDDLHQCGRS